MSPPPAPRADLVLEGGGVKGIGLAGAIDALAAADYSFPRVAGSSAGAIAGALVAGLQHAGEPLPRLSDIARSLDYTKFRDRGWLGRLLGPLGFLADGASLVFEDGLYEGEYLRDWLSGVLRDLGVATFGDLKTDDPGSDLPATRRYSLVVTASDLSAQRLALFPWDYPSYGLDPDEQSVADAVRASAAIPFFFEPSQLKSPRERRPSGTSTLVDGGLLSRYPIDIFDRADGRVPRWPTIGVRLSAREDGIPAPKKVDGLIDLAITVVSTAIEGANARHIDSDCNAARTVFVDTSGVSSVDFDISEQQQDRLFSAGQQAGQRFLSRWDFQDWLHRCRGVQNAPVPRT